MNFASDNWAGVAAPIAEALAEAATGPAPAYGGDRLTREVEAMFAELFEREVTVFFVATGTAANTLSLSALARPGGLVFCHRDAHINTDEGAAAEFLTALKLIGLGGAEGRLAPDTLAAAIHRYPPDPGRHGQPVALSLSNLTEYGTAYAPAEVAALSKLAHGAKLGVHMDGARFGNAVASLGVSPAELTWKAGVDILSFGGTKGGCWLAEAVVFFDRDRAADFAYIRKRAAHTISKQRFIAAQLKAYLEGGLWLTLAGAANAAAKRLADGIAAIGGRLAWPAAGNELFAVLPSAGLARAKAAGASFYEWEADWMAGADRPRADETIVRLVTSYATEAAEIDRFLTLLAGE